MGRFVIFRTRTTFLGIPQLLDKTLSQELVLHLPVLVAERYTTILIRSMGLENVHTGSLQAELARVVYDRDEEDVLISCVKEIPLVSIHNRDLKLSKDTEVKLPRWVARILVKHGLAKTRTSKRYAVPGITKAGMNEERDRELTKLDAYFYISVGEELDKMGASGTRLSTLKRERSFRLFRDLLVKRLNKIVKLAEKGKGISHTVHNLIPEEQLLMTELSELIDSWKDFFLGDDEAK